MRLVTMLERAAVDGAGLFRRMLAKEDAERLAKLRRLAHERETLEDFRKHALFIGWTKDDMRTHELKEHLAPVMDAVFAYEREGGGEAADSALDAAWRAFDAQRLKILVHCL